MKNISAQVIFYEGKWAEKCISQISKVADEIVVVRGRQKSYPYVPFRKLNLELEKIKYYECEEVFETELEHRLFALEKADKKFDIIWFVDADEYYDDENLQKIIDYEDDFDILKCNLIDYFKDTNHIILPKRNQITFIKRKVLESIDMTQKTIFESINQSIWNVVNSDITRHHLSLCEPEEIQLRRLTKALYRFRPEVYKEFEFDVEGREKWLRENALYFTGKDERYTIKKIKTKFKLPEGEKYDFK